MEAFASKFVSVCVQNVCVGVKLLCASLQIRVCVCVWRVCVRLSCVSAMKSVCWAAKPAKCKSISRKIVSIAQYSHKLGPKTPIFGCTKKDVIPEKPLKQGA